MTAITIPGPSAAPGAALRAAATFWVVTAMLGQGAFLFYMLSFYWPSTLAGNFHDWSRNPSLVKGYVAGDPSGNLFFAAHVLLAAIVTLGGAIQLVPWIRSKALPLHRWNGRVFMVTAIGIGLDGLYLVWVRHSSPTLLGAVAISLNAALIFGFVSLAWRTALKRDIQAHRRWAMRSYMVANGQWFIRVGVFAVMLLAKPLTGRFFVVWSFGCYLVPLVGLEFYFRAHAARTGGVKLAMAAILCVLAVLIVLGTVEIYLTAWRPLLQPLRLVAL